MTAKPTRAVMDTLGMEAEARFVGGAVRDTIAGMRIGDVDIATPLPPDRVMDLLKSAGIKVVPTGLAHGTVTAVIDGAHFEITTLRRDVKTYGRHADVVFTDDWREDAARRDFTINAMSMTQAGEVFDYSHLGLRRIAIHLERHNHIVRNECICRFYIETSCHVFILTLKRGAEG